MLPDILKNLGLDKKETDIFLQLARMDSAPASRVAQKTRLRRTTCYQILENLVQKKFLKRTIRFGIRYYSALTPEELEARIEESLHPLTSAQTLLKAGDKEIRLFYGKNNPETKISFYEGFEEIKLVYDKILAEDDREIYSLIRKQDTTGHPLQMFWKKYFKRRLALGKHTYTIVPKDQQSKTYIDDSRKEKRQTMAVDPKKLHVFGDLKVSGNLFAYVSQHEGRIFGITMESPEIAAMFRDIIKILWQNFADNQKK